MQVKKFEAPTIQEALETIKRELGPEAIILQTKKNKRGFGLLSKASVEVTAAVSERSLHKKKFYESRQPEPAREAMGKLKAGRQAEVLDKYADKHIDRVAKATQDRVEVSRRSEAAAAPAAKITATRYIDIGDDATAVKREALPPRPAPTQVPAPVRQPAAGAIAGKLGATGAAGGMTVEEELRHLKRMIEEMKNTQDSAYGDGTMGSGAQLLMSQSTLESPALQDGFEQLVVGGMDKRYALTLIKRVAFELGAEKSGNPEFIAEQLATEVMQSTEVLSPLSGVRPRQEGQGPVVIALVGPTGVGKTTTVAKIASEALLKRNLKVGLINLDSYKIAAFDQLATYAKILKVPFRSVSSHEDLTAAIADFRTLDLVLIDTTGRSQRDPSSLKDMEAMLRPVQNLRSFLVLAVTTRDTELYDMANRFAIFRSQGIIASKLDEATVYGAIYNVSQRTKLPLLYFTTGQRVPEDIEEASRERVAALILDL